MNTAARAGEVKRSMSGWLERMAEGLAPGRFRFCERGRLVPAKTHGGQFVTCFAVKVAWHTGLWNEWPEERRRGATEFIRSFQRKRDGRFVDRAMQLRFLAGAVADRLRRPTGASIESERAVVAESRQSAATLLQVGALPAYPMPEPHKDTDSVRAFIRALDWNIPWGAGSHASHLIFFLHANATLDGRKGDPRIDAAFDELDSYRDPASGTWFAGENVALQMRINGAMKVLTAYRWTGRPLKYAEQLLDTALNAKFAEDGCSFLNRLFVVQQARVHAPDYRTEDVHALAERCFERALAFRQEDGGISFYPGRAQRRYYDAYVSLGGNQSDMHGSTMLTWAMAISLEILGLAGTTGWRPSNP